MYLECVCGSDNRQTITVRVTYDDMPKLDALFSAVRGMLELDAPKVLRANAPSPVDGPAASIGDVPEGRETANSETDAAPEHIAEGLVEVEEQGFVGHPTKEP